MNSEKLFPLELKDPDNTRQVGIQGLESAFDKSIDYRDWHKTSAALELMLSNLSGKTLEDLVVAIQQLESIIPELVGEIGVASDTLELAPVSPFKKAAAMVFSKFFTELKSVTRRAELREEAEVRLVILEKVKEQLVDLRNRLSVKVDEMILIRSKDKFPELYQEFKDIQSQESNTKATSKRLDSLDADRLIDGESMNNGKKIGARRNAPRSAAFIRFYEEYTGNKLDDESEFSLRDMYTRMKEIEVQLEERLSSLESRKFEIMEEIKLKLDSAS
jgi:hypothetical protein